MTLHSITFVLGYLFTRAQIIAILCNDDPEKKKLAEKIKAESAQQFEERLAEWRAAGADFNEDEERAVEKQELDTYLLEELYFDGDRKVGGFTIHYLPHDQYDESSDTDPCFVIGFALGEMETRERQLLKVPLPSAVAEAAVILGRDRAEDVLGIYHNQYPCLYTPLFPEPNVTYPVTYHVPLARFQPRMAALLKSNSMVVNQKPAIYLVQDDCACCS